MFSEKLKDVTEKTNIRQFSAPVIAMTPLLYTIVTGLKRYRNNKR